MATLTKKTNPGFSNYVDELRQYTQSDVIVKPFIDPENPRQNMGLEKYGQVLFEGTAHEQKLKCTIHNGIVKYTTGLDEFAESVKRLPDEEREAKVRSIRETVSKLEKELYANTLKTDDPDFWSKTKLAPNKSDYWASVSFVVGNEGITLDPSDPHDLIKIIAAEAGGFDEVAGSYESAKASPMPPKFYLERRKDARVQESVLRQLRDKAIYELFKIKNEQPQRLFWLVKNLLPIANQYKKTDPIDIFYGDLSSFIEGVGIVQDKKKAPEKFINMVHMEMEYVQIRAYVLEAAFQKRIITKGDNKIYNRDTGSLLGANLEDVVFFLKEPVNQLELDNIQNQIDAIWSR